MAGLDDAINSLFGMISSVEYTPPGSNITFGYNRAKEEERKLKEEQLKQEKVKSIAAQKELEVKFGKEPKLKMLLPERTSEEKTIGAGYKPPTVAAEVTPGTVGTEYQQGQFDLKDIQNYGKIFNEPVPGGKEVDIKQYGKAWVVPYGEPIKKTTALTQDDIARMKKTGTFTYNEVSGSTKFNTMLPEKNPEFPGDVSNPRFYKPNPPKTEKTSTTFKPSDELFGVVNEYNSKGTTPTPEDVAAMKIRYSPQEVYWLLSKIKKPGKPTGSKPGGYDFGKIGGG